MLQKNQSDMQVEEVELLCQQLKAYQADFDMERQERRMTEMKVLEIKKQVIISLIKLLSIRYL